MFREMRRNRQMLSEEECVAILERGSAGVLSLQGDDGYPYGVPISYVYHKGKLYFHSAAQGHKIDAVKNSPRASFCVIADDLVVPETYTTLFRSVVVFGQIQVIEDEEEKRKALGILGKKYHPLDTEAHRMDVVDKSLGRVCMLELGIAHMTGKEARELANMKES
ncbi:MAG: pyridoxamine 5'-phosphate oxidase family protein [Hungatella sp.]|nr:pyridoxamine 5'-phosphate oxidase family protein [Hungatella sp.]